MSIEILELKLRVACGDATAMFSLAKRYESGTVVQKNTAYAIQLFELAIGYGDVYAMLALGNIFLLGKDGVPRDAARAKHLYEQAVDAGSVLAMISLGLLLHAGDEGVPRDAVYAKRLYERAVAAGHVQGMVSLALLLHHGSEGVPRDAVTAKRLYERAVDSGNVLAMTKLGRLLRHGAEGVPKDAVTATRLYERAVDTGDVAAMTGLGCLLERGDEGVTKDAVRAKQLYEHAINAGNASAMFLLGDLLRHGDKNVPKDVVRAKQLYERAVDAGNAAAMTELGCLLCHGDEGIPKDAIRAKQLYEHALNAGDVGAMDHLGHLFHHGDENVPKDAVRAKQLYERAVNAGNVIAMLYLGALLEVGEVGVSKDAVRAKQLYELGASKGFAPARRALARLLGAECSLLTTAFCYALSCPEVLSLAYLGNHIRAIHVVSASDLLAGHNLVLLSIRTGVLTPSNIASVGDSAWHFQQNLYLPATKLNTGNAELVDSVFFHAESIGLIKDGFTLKALREFRADIHQGDKVTSKVFGNLAYRVWTVEPYVSKAKSDVSWVETSVDLLHSELGHLSSNQRTLQRAAVNLSSSLKLLRSVFQKRDCCSKYSRLAQCVLSFIAVMCAPLENTTEVFADLTAEDFMETGTGVPKHMISNLISADLSNFQVARLIMSDKVVSKMSPVAADAVRTAVIESGFVSIKALESMIGEEIEAAGRENPSKVSLDVGSPSWMDGI